MSTNGTPAQPYYPQIDKSVDPKVTVHLQRVYPALNDHDRAIDLLNAKIKDIVSGKTIIQKTTTQVSSTASAGVSSFNTLTGAISYFPYLGTVNDQSGATAYMTQTSDNGALLIFDDPSAVAATLNAAVTAPFLVFITNYGAGAVTITPSAGTINGGGSFVVPQNFTAIVFFDSPNWWATAFSVVTLPNFADQETPSGSINGSNVTFTLANSPNPKKSAQLFLGGLIQDQGVGLDYTLSTNVITFTTAPSSGPLLIWYRY